MSYYSHWHNIRHELFRKWEGFHIWLAYSIVPKRLAYWCAIRVIFHATTGEYSEQVVPELTAMDALKRYGDDHRI